MLKRILLIGVCPILLFLFSCKKTNDTLPKLKYHADGEVSQLIKSDIPLAVNVVIVGDGYQKDDLLVNGLFDTKANDVSAYLFSTPPFSTYKSYFNVYKLYTESSNLNNKVIEAGYSKFNTYANGNFNLNLANIRGVKSYVKNAIPDGVISIIILLTNNNDPVATGNGNVSMITSAEGSLPLLLHRLGHNFANLGDEYVSPEMYAAIDKSLLKSYPNLDVTSEPTKVKWASYLKNTAYKSAIGVYEGGFYVAKGVYRPEANSVMLNTSVCSSYNAPSREAIARLIFQICGMPFDLADFLEKDKSAIQPRMIPSPITINPATDYPPGISY